MSVRVAINGFGRIGRNVLRAIVEAKRGDITVVAINDLAPPETNAHLLRFEFGARPLSGRGHGHRRHAGLRHRPDQGHRHPGSGAAAVAGARGRHRARMHRPVHHQGEGFGASGRRGQARAGVGPRRPRGPHGGLRRQSRQADPRPQGGVERLLHHQLPGPARQGAQRRGRDRQGLHDHGARLYQRSALARPVPQGSSTGRAPPPCR